ncbi:putative lactoylglutathione lyase protein [Cylindrospermum sp. NIES-4074]|nr:putative lactoylglutathione lyase protein [Cylindrospermum sp. NIES-4074]
MRVTTNLYPSFSVSNFERSLAFYDVVMATVGVPRWNEIESKGIREAEYGSEEDLKRLSIIESPNYSSENTQIFSSSLSFRAENKSEVDTFFITAIANGANEVEKPGFREDNSYSASVKDPDGHEIGAYCSNSN